MTRTQPTCITVGCGRKAIKCSAYCNTCRVKRKAPSRGMQDQALRALAEWARKRGEARR